jgi:SHS2 domain-containing protein
MWKIEDHTADACLFVEAPTWLGLLEEAARAFGAWLVSNGKPPAGPLDEERVAVGGADATETWVHWWKAMHHSWTVNGRLPLDARVDVTSTPEAVRARLLSARTEAIDPADCVDVKAVTWHRATVERKADGSWSGRIVLDI